MANTFYQNSVEMATLGHVCGQGPLVTPGKELAAPMGGAFLKSFQNRLAVVLFFCIPLLLLVLSSL